MRGRVDAERHAADHGDAGGCKPAAEAAGHLDAVAPSPPRPDDGDGRRIAVHQHREPLDVAGDVQDRGRIAGLEHPRRVALVVAADRMHRRRG